MSNIYAIDIETAPGYGFENFEDAALDHHRNRITLIAVASKDFGKVFTSVSDFNSWLGTVKQSNTRFVYHNGKFDLKTLITKGAHLTVDDYGGDTMLQAVAHSNKVSEFYLKQYEADRSAINKELGGTKNVHRRAGQYSLKVLAPYILGVPRFWETANHENVEYALKDATYTYELHEAQQALLATDNTLDFYENKIMNWARMLLRAELAGITLDGDKLRDEWDKEEIRKIELEEELYDLWAEGNRRYVDQERNSVRLTYAAKMDTAVKKLKHPTPEAVMRTTSRYEALMDAALAKLPTRINLNSPTQLSWLLRDYLGLDITDPMDEDEESTGKLVLQGLAAKGHKDIATFLSLRESHKLATAFFPSYKEKAYNGKLHTTFRIEGARTGRLSCSGPNLQQVPRSARFRSLFRARPGHKLVVYDLGAIEPVVIAYLTEDPTLCKLLIEGKNFHSNNVRIFFDVDADDKTVKAKYAVERDLAKEVGLALMYGAGPRRLMMSAQKRGFEWTFAKCKQIYSRFKAAYRPVFDFKADLDASLEGGAPMENVLGRKLKIINSEDVYMKGFNTLIQSSASDMLLNAAFKASQELDSAKAYPLLFVHDEVVSESEETYAPHAAMVLKSQLEGYKLNTAHGLIPVTAEGGIYDCWQK